tara:strand:- start:347 stop:469 length:123 start_codon:yes stop_codon:yes gene_type:complete
MYEVFAIIGGVFGLVAYIRVEKLIKNLKKKGLLDKNYKLK